MQFRDNYKALESYFEWGNPLQEKEIIKAIGRILMIFLKVQIIFYNKATNKTMRIDFHLCLYIFRFWKLSSKILKYNVSN